MRIFLAGPFFNQESRIVLSRLLNFLEHKLHCEVFCAMRDGALVPKDAPEKIRQKYFQLDVDEIKWAEVLIALIEYPLPIYQRLCLVEQTPEKTILNNIYFPDMGTVFEMGLAYALKKPIIGFTSNIHSLNLMLTQSCEIVVSSYEKLANTLYEIEHQTFIKKPFQKELFQL